LFFPIKWKTSIDIPINGTLVSKSLYVFIQNIAITGKFNTRFFEKHHWDFKTFSGFATFTCINESLSLSIWSVKQ
jgi:hypothetical protein